jgi:GH43 family beta-xylosidase
MTRRLASGLLTCLLALAGCGGGGGAADGPGPAAIVGGVDSTFGASAQFVNPIVAATRPEGSADPSVVFRNGVYYYCRSLHDGAIGIAMASRLQDIGIAPMVTVWTPPDRAAYSQELWAPELQFLQGKWYVYFAASDGNNQNHRMYVLQAESDDPQKAYSFKGRVAAPVDEWAIDGLVIENAGALYFVWSGWRGAADGFPQVAYIAPMSNPWTISGDRHELAAPDRLWEQAGAPLIEAPAVLYRGDKIYLTYSAGASWSDDYALGLLTYAGGDILLASSWVKADAPVFTKRPQGGAYGPGHNSFVKSPDGKEDWIVYHAIDSSAGGWAQRSVRAQAFQWNADGSPAFGVPVAPGVRIAEPSGSASATALGPAKPAGQARIPAGSVATFGAAVERIRVRSAVEAPQTLGL